MERFEDKIAVITGAGTGMGRELATLLAAEGCHLALCDVNTDNLAMTRNGCEAANDAVRVTVHRCDVSVEADVLTFRDEVVDQHHTDHINLLFNNAGIGGTPSFVDGDRATWERTFDVCWYGVYYCSRAFVPLLVAGPEGHIVNTSSVNGFWASVGPTRTHTSYSAAKFAVKGFTEALVTDLRVTAPHVKASVVMPGHIGTEIVANSTQVLGGEMSPELTEAANSFRNRAPTTARQAAEVILDGVRADEWRILVGDDAHVLDSLVREDPSGAYEPAFIERLRSLGVFEGIVS